MSQEYYVQSSESLSVPMQNVSCVAAKDVLVQKKSFSWRFVGHQAFEDSYLHAHDPIFAQLSMTTKNNCLCIVFEHAIFPAFNNSY